MTPNERSKKAPKTTSKTASKPKASDTTYDAIVIGAGHNGMVNGSYLATAGLKPLSLDRLAHLGGAPITEQLQPGHWFTTSSYA